VGLFGRRKPLHRRLAEEGGLVLDTPAAGAAAQPPGWFGEARGEPGIHGLQRSRRWDAVATADAPGLRGDTVHFVALPDRTLLVDEDEPDGALAPLADAIEQALAPPYRAEAVRRAGDTWAVAGSSVTLVEVPGLEGDEVELVSSREGRTLRVDGQAVPGSAPALEAVGEAVGPDHVVRGRRVDGDVGEVEATPL
jgi:hypothetical protein